MSYLLDTRVLLWLLADPDRIPKGVRGLLADRSNALLVSAISAFEIATKARLGKLDAGELPFTLVTRIAGILVTVDSALGLSQRRRC